MRTVAVNEVIDQGKFNRFYQAVFWVCMWTTIFDGFDLNVFSLVVPSLMKDWALTPTQIGLLGSYGFVGMILGSIVFGPIAEWIGRRRALLMATIVYCVFTAAVGCASNFTEFAIYRTFAGLGLAGAFPLAIAYGAEYSPLAIRSRLTVWITSGQPVGTVLGTLAGILLLSTYGWRVMFFVAAAPVIIIFWQYFLPESMGYYLRKGQKEKISQVLTAANPSFLPTPEDEYKLSGFNAGRSDVTALFTKGMAKNTILFWLIFICNYIFTFGVLTWLPKLMTILGWSLNVSLFFTLTWNAGFILGLPISGWSQDKFGGKRTLVVIAFCLAVCTATIGQISNPVVLSVLLFVTGACQHSLMCVTGSYISQNYPITCRSTGTTFGYGAGRIGGIIGPLVGSMLLTYNVSVAMNLVIFACVPLISALLVTFTTDRARIALETLQGTIPK
ncbi:MAG: pcaK 2 [Firmicutes bacterium]|nr:pcaK 2 [Bacillota bacterium]